MESAEHAAIGDKVMLKFDSGPVSAQGHKLYAGHGGTNSLYHDDRFVSYGEGIALGGDFYGLAAQPISTASDQQAAFKAAYGTLLGSDPALTPKILAIMQVEAAAVAQAQRQGQQPSAAYEQLGDTLSGEWNVATGGGGAITNFLPMGTYLQLAAVNWDHFGSNAIAAYRAGHAVANQFAAAIRLRPLAERPLLFQQAYAMNAFADHFLTDLFSAGHLRVPRKELFDQITTPLPGFTGSLGSLLARAMHDEDSENGLVVHNAQGATWKAYGDKRLLDSANAANLAMVCQAAQISANEVYDSYTSGVASQAMGALSLVPDLRRVGIASNRENGSPLFTLQGGTVACRNSITDRSDYSWTTTWVGLTTFAQIKAIGLIKDLLVIP
jgi:hypothetical protein